jgi:class 3 adenylate cyclase
MTLALESIRTCGGLAMTFEEVLDQAIDMLRRRGRLTYRTLRRQFDLDDTTLEDLKEEILFAHPQVVDEQGRGLVWVDDRESERTAAPTSAARSASPRWQNPSPLDYTPQHLTEKILTSRAALEGERKQVTVLFADIKDSTELIKDLDPEAAQKLLDPAIHIMMDAVHRFEGTVNQVLGDGIMALFGAPIAHEDYALRACYAALAMQVAMRDYTEEVRRAHGLELRIRVGLNTGEVVVRTISNDLHMDYSAVGSTTHLAARMEQLATPGTTRLTGATLRLVEGLVRVNALGPIPVKGMTEPVETYELLAASTIRRRLQAAVARGLTRFVGRETEMDALTQALARATAGHGQVVAAVGEAGIGKSRLFYEFVHSHHTQGWSVLESASVSYGKATPYFPVVDLLKRYAHVEEGDESRAIRAKVTGQVLTLDETLQESIPALLSLLDVLPADSPFHRLEPPQRRQRTLDALKRLLLREGQVQPLLLVFEDLHWVDSETQALLDSLVESLPTAQLLLLVNYRPDYHHGWGSKTYYTRLRLDPLLPESAEAFLQALLGDDLSLESLKQFLIERTEGNPFFLEECVRTLVETQKLVGEPGAYRLALELATIQVPPTVQAILAARIDRLAPVDKRLLQTAAVIGRDVPFTLLQAMAQLPDVALHQGLTRLQTAEFLYEASLFPELKHTFKHALTLQVAYGSLLQEQRQALHGRAGEGLERLYAAQLEEYYEQLAYHFSRSNHREKAREYLVKTGHKAAHRYANQEALEAFQQALGLTREGEEHDHILGQCAKLRLGLFRGKEAASDYERLLARARQWGNRPQELESLLGLASACYIISIDEPDVAPQALDLYQRAYALARQLDDKVGMVRALVPASHFIDFWPEYRDQAMANTEEAVALSHEIGDEDLLIDSLTAFYRCKRRAVGYTDEIEAQSEALLKRIEARHDLLRLKEHYFSLMNLHFSRGNFARCVECCDAGISLAAEIGALPVMYPTLKAFALLHLGRYDAAWAALQREIADAAHPVGRMMQELGTGMYFLELMAYDKACATLAHAIDHTRRLQRWLFGRRAQILLAKALVGAGRLDQVEIRSMMQDLTRMSASLPSGGTSDLLEEQGIAELLLAEGQLHEALHQAEAAASQAASRGLRAALVSAWEVKLRILLQLKRPADAAGLVKEALQAAEEMGDLPMVWRIQAAKAQALTRLGDTTGAAQAYEQGWRCPIAPTATV